MRPRTIADIDPDIAVCYEWEQDPDSCWYGWLWHEAAKDFHMKPQTGRTCPGCGSRDTGHLQSLYYCGLVCNNCSLRFTHEEADEVEWEEAHPNGVLCEELQVQEGAPS